MRINELLTESQQELTEGPLLNKVGSAVGKAAGGVAKGVGAVAGGIAGLGTAAKKGFTAGKQTVAGAGDTDPNAAQGSGASGSAGNAPAQGGTANTAAGNAPAQGGTANTAAGQQSGSSGPIAPPGGGMVQSIKNAWNKYQPKGSAGTTSGAPAAGGGASAAPAQTGGDQSAPTTASDINAAGPKGTAAAKQQTGAAGAAIDKTAAATQNKSADQAGQTMYAQVKSQINNLDKKGKQRILQLLQKSLQQAPAKPAANPAQAEPASPARTPGASPAAGGTGFGYDGHTGKPFTSQAERDAWDKAHPKGTPKAEPTAPVEQPAAPAAETPPAVEPTKPAPKKRAPPKKKAAPDQAEIDASRERMMGNFTDSVERHKQRMVAESIAKNTFSIFKK
jgi:hypothetical protein